MWLIYLRFDDKGEVKTYHIRADNKIEAEEVLGLAEKRGFNPTEMLVEYAVFYSQRLIKPKEAPNFHSFTNREFIARWKQAEQA